MSSVSVKELLVAARAKIALIATSRDASELFHEHKTSQPFAKSPNSKRDGFEVVFKDKVLTGAFGVLGQKETMFQMVVRLGHAPFGTDDTRENYRAEDVARIVDILESFAWPAGTQTVLYESEVVNKDDANWWLSELMFKVVIAGDVRTV